MDILTLKKIPLIPILSENGHFNKSGLLENLTSEGNK